MTRLFTHRGRAKACKHLWLYNLGRLGLHYAPLTSKPAYIIGRQCTRCGKTGKVEA